MPGSQNQNIESSFFTKFSKNLKKFFCSCSNSNTQIYDIERPEVNSLSIVTNPHEMERQICSGSIVSELDRINASLLAQQENDIQNIREIIHDLNRALARNQNTIVSNTNPNFTLDNDFNQPPEMQNPDSNSAAYNANNIY